MSNNLQLDPDLNLEKTNKTIRQKDVKEQHYILPGNDTERSSLEEVRYGKWHRKPTRPEVRPPYIQRDTNRKSMNRADNSHVQGVTAQSTTMGKCAQNQVQDTILTIKGVIIVRSAFQGKPLPVLVR